MFYFTITFSLKMKFTKCHFSANGNPRIRYEHNLTAFCVKLELTKQVWRLAHFDYGKSIRPSR